MNSSSAPRVRLLPRLAVLLACLALLVEAAPSAASRALVAGYALPYAAVPATTGPTRARMGPQVSGILNYLELVELWCAEVGVPWPGSRRIGGCAGKWDEVVEPWKLDLSNARSWIHWESGREGSSLLEMDTVDKLSLPPSSPSTKWLLWYGLLDWRSGLVIDVRINSGYRRLLCFRPPLNVLESIATYAEECRGPKDFKEYQGKRVIHTLPTAAWRGSRGYVAGWLPGSVVKTTSEIRTRVIDLPLSSTGARDSNIREHIVSTL